MKQTADGKALRLFIAIELPEKWKEALAAESQVLDRAAPGFGRWVDPSLMHLTLVFLGSQPSSALAAIQDAMDHAGAKSRGFSLRLEEAGSFGSPRSIRVVWVGVKDSPPVALATAQRTLSETLRAAAVAFQEDHDSFRPHLTLARARRDATPTQSQAIAAAIARRRSDRSTPWPEPHEVGQLTLVRSDLRPTGPMYTPLYKAPIGAGARGPEDRPPK